MPRLPKNVVKRGETYYFRKKVHGRLVRKALGPDLREAKRRAILLRQELEQNPDPPAPVLTVETFGERWLSECVGLSRNAKGQKLARQRLEQHIEPVIGKVGLSEVRSSDVRRVRVAIEAKKLKPQTVRHILSDLRSLLRYAVEAGILDKSPAVASVMPRIPENAPDALTRDEVEKILGVAHEKYRLAIGLALLTGLRWGEAHRLQWRHVHWKPTPHLVLDKTKSGKVRRVPLLPEAVDLLRQERLHTTSLFVLPFRMKNPCSFVYGISRKIDKKAREEAEKAGKPVRDLVPFRWHFHQLRHTFACRYLEREGASLAALQRILGHSSVRMTERYARLSDEAVFSEVQRLGSKTGPTWGHIGPVESRKAQ